MVITTHKSVNFCDTAKLSGKEELNSYIIVFGKYFARVVGTLIISKHHFSAEIISYL